MARAAFVVCALACTLASGFAPRAPAPRRAAATAARAATPASDFVNLDTAAADRLAGKVSGAMEAVEAVTDRSPGVEKVGVSKTYALKAATTKETKAASQPKASKGEIKARARGPVALALALAADSLPILLYMHNPTLPLLLLLRRRRPSLLRRRLLVLVLLLSRKRRATTQSTRSATSSSRSSR